ncbi:MAG: hypothetical protein Kow0062_26830 [Acidobacteriota bacterium]
MPESRDHLVTIHDLVGLRRPLETAARPGAREVAFSLAEADFHKGETRVQVHLAPHPDPPRDAPRESLALTHGFDNASRPAWSPDGRRLAFLTFRPQPHEDEEDDQRDDGATKLQVFVMPRAGGEAHRISDAPEGVEAFAFTGDGAHVLTLGPQARPPAERGWRRRRREAHDDPEIADGDVPRYEIREYPLDGGDPVRLLGDLRGIESFDVSPDGRLLVYATNHTGLSKDYEKLEVVLCDLDTGARRPLTGGRGGAESGPRFSSDGRFVFFHGWADPGCAFSRQELFAVDLRAPGPPRPLLAGIDRDLEEFAPLGDGRVAALVAWGLESRLVVADPRDGDVCVVPIEGHALSGIDAAGTGVSLVVETGGSPPEVAWVDVADPRAARLETLTSLNPRAASWIRARRRRVRWACEGFEHEGLLLLPPDEAPRHGTPPPLLVWLHGGPHWRVVDHLALYDAEAWAAAGWAVFVPQYRGSSGHDERYSRALAGDIGGGDVRDILAGLDRLVADGLVDAERVAVGGASYGAYLTNWLLATTDRFRAGISIAGIYDLAQDYGTSDAFAWEVHYLGGPPWEKPELYRERSVLTHVAGLEAPLLLLHGIEDDNTYLTNAKALYRALTALDRTVQFVGYPREGHGLHEPPHLVDAFRRSLSWLERHVLGRDGRFVDGTPLEQDGLRVVPLGWQTPRDLAGVEPPEGSVWLEVSFVLEATDDGPPVLSLVASGPSADVALVDEHADVYRPLGVAHDVHGQLALLRVAGGRLEAVRGPQGQPPSLAATLVFQVPDRPATWRVSIAGAPGYLLDVDPGAAPERPDGAAPAGS